jgi:hypothetical protein
MFANPVYLKITMFTKIPGEILFNLHKMSTPFTAIGANWHCLWFFVAKISTKG